MARDNVSEELLQLRKRARRRLIGAVTLVIFALIVLWTVLDGEPPAALTHQVEIIASAPSTTSSAVASAPHIVAATTAAPSLVPQQTDNGAVQAPAAEQTNTAPLLPGKLVNSQIAPAEKPVAKTPLEKPATKPAETKATEKIAEKPKATPTPKPAKDPQKILDGMEEGESKPAAPAKVESGHNIVQIGAYGDKDKARSIVGILKTNGIAAYAEPVSSNGVSLTRVRIGPADEAHAKTIMQKAKALGYAPVLVH